MALALLDILINSQPAEEIGQDEYAQLYLSIYSHLSRLLNTRCGSLVHMPDYGLPDMNQIYKDLPYSLQLLINAIHATISKYEPRLTHLLIQQDNSQSRSDGIIRLHLQGKIAKKYSVNFNTYFTAAGNTKIIGQQLE